MSRLTVEERLKRLEEKLNELIDAFNDHTHEVSGVDTTTSPPDQSVRRLS